MEAAHHGRDGIDDVNHNDVSALSHFVMALKVGQQRSSTVITELLEVATKAIEAGEIRIDALRLNGLRVTDNDVEHIVNGLVSAGITVRRISMASNHISDEGVRVLLRLLDDEPGYRCMLASIDLRGNDIGPLGCKLLADRLRTNATITSLDLSSNKLGPDAGSSIAQMLAENVAIERLVIRSTDMSEAGLCAVVAVLREGNSSVRELSIGGQLIRSSEEVVAYHISRTLETRSCILRSLDLSSCRIGDEGASLLRSALTGHRTMRSLDLSRNHIGITGGQALATLLLGNCTISSLSLRANSIGDEGAGAFKVVLLHNKTLTMLDVRSNGINDAGLTALAEGMECNASLERLFVWGNNFGQGSLKRLGQLEGGRFALVGVFIDVKPFAVDGVFHAAENAASEGSSM